LDVGGTLGWEPLEQAYRRVQFYAFDTGGDAGKDLRKLPLHLRKKRLTQGFSRRGLRATFSAS
jgi:ATP-dependent DNA ligase